MAAHPRRDSTFSNLTDATEADRDGFEEHAFGYSVTVTDQRQPTESPFTRFLSMCSTPLPNQNFTNQMVLTLTLILTLGTGEKSIYGVKVALEAAVEGPAGAA